MTKRKFRIKPGQYLIQDLSSATGGITYKRNKAARRARGAGYSQKIETRKHVDHEQLIILTDELVQQARYILRCNAANTPLGWVADSAGLKCIQEGFVTARGEDYPGFVELTERAAALNRRSARLHSERVVRIACVPIRLEVDNAAAAAEVARTVREVCQDLLTVCRAGTVSHLEKILLRTKNLERLATGMQRDSVIFAVECAKGAGSQLRKVIKGQPRKAHERLLRAAGKQLDLEALEACIGMFADMSTAELCGSGGRALSGAA